MRLVLIFSVLITSISYADKNAYMWSVKTPIVVRGEIIAKTPSNQISYKTGKRFNQYSIMADQVLRSTVNQISYDFLINESFTLMLKHDETLKVGDYALFFIGEDKDPKNETGLALEFYFSEEFMKSNLNKTRSLYSAVWEGNIERQLNKFPGEYYDQQSESAPKTFKAQYRLLFADPLKKKAPVFEWIKRSESEFFNQAVELSVHSELQTFDFPFASLTIESTAYRKEKIELPNPTIEHTVNVELKESSGRD